MGQHETSDIRLSMRRRLNVDDPLMAAVSGMLWGF
jgi:hypothetical protein